MFFPLAGIVVIMLACWGVIHYINKSADELLKNAQTVTLSEDEIIEMIVVLADWTEMNDLRLLNNKSRTDIDSGHYDETFTKAIAKTLDSVKAFQEKF